MKNAFKVLLGVVICSLAFGQASASFKLQVKAHPRADNVDKYLGMRRTEHFHIINDADGHLFNFDEEVATGGVVFKRANKNKYIKLEQVTCNNRTMTIMKRVKNKADATVWTLSGDTYSATIGSATISLKKAN